MLEDSAVTVSLQVASVYDFKLLFLQDCVKACQAKMGYHKKKELELAHLDFHEFCSSSIRRIPCALLEGFSSIAKHAF